MSKQKINPRRKPATWADVDKAWEKGVLDGVNNATAIFLSVLCDKFNGEEYVQDVWNEINKLSAEIAEKRVTISDLKTVLRNEYKIGV